MTLVTQPFSLMAEVEKAGMGNPDLPVVTIPHPLMNRTPEELTAMARAILPQVIDALIEGASS